MGRAMEVISGRVTNAAALTGWTVNTGDSLSVRSFAFGDKASWLDSWASSATAGVLRVRSPRMHDNVQNVRVQVPAADQRALTDDWFDQGLYPQDTLVVDQQGGGAETDTGHILNYYDNLPGTSARLFDWATIMPLIKNMLTTETSPVTSATAGDNGAGVALDSTFDLLKANVDYAILGYVLNTAVGAVCVEGPDVGNLRIGGPGALDPVETRGWFVRQSQRRNRPMIPVVNAANKGSTLVSVTDPAVSATVVVDLIMAELSGSPD